MIYRTGDISLGLNLRSNPVFSYLERNKEVKAIFIFWYLFLGRLLYTSVSIDLFNHSEPSHGSWDHWCALKSFFLIFAFIHSFFFCGGGGFNFHSFFFAKFLCCRMNSFAFTFSGLFFRDQNLISLLSGQNGDRKSTLSRLLWKFQANDLSISLIDANLKNLDQSQGTDKLKAAWTQDIAKCVRWMCGGMGLTVKNFFEKDVSPLRIPLSISSKKCMFLLFGNFFKVRFSSSRLNLNYGRKFETMIGASFERYWTRWNHSLLRSLLYFLSLSNFSFKCFPPKAL